MEQQKKKNHPSLPSNYVTLAQLQERWLKQQNQVNQPQQQPEEDQQKDHQHLAVVAPTNVTDSVSRSHPSKRYRPKNRDDSGTNRRKNRNDSGTNCRKNRDDRNDSGTNRRKNGDDSGTNRRPTEVASEDRRKSETGAGVGDENAGVNGKVGESKNKKEKEIWKAKRKPKVEKRGASEEGTAAAQGNEDAEKTTIESALNDKKEGDSILTVEEEAEQKFGDLSMNSGNGKQNEGLRRMKDGFRGSQSQRNSRGGRGGGYRYGYSRGQQQRFEVGMQKSEKKMVWVRKDSGVGKIET